MLVNWGFSFEELGLLVLGKKGKEVEARLDELQTGESGVELF